MANEYIFFDETLRDSFAGFVADRGIAASMRPDEIEGYVVVLPEFQDDELEDAVEAEYEALMDAQRELVESAEAGDARKLMGVTVTLPDGQTRLVRLPALYARRLLEQFTVEEIHELVSAVARDVANPVSGPICRQA
jgi:hypothetical protein